MKKVLMQVAGILSSTGKIVGGLLLITSGDIATGTSFVISGMGSLVKLITNKKQSTEGAAVAE